MARAPHSLVVRAGIRRRPGSDLVRVDPAAAAVEQVEGVPRPIDLIVVRVIEAGELAVLLDECSSMKSCQSSSGSSGSESGTSTRAWFHASA